MRPSLKKLYRVKELFLYSIITTAIKESRISFSNQDLFNLCMVNKDFAIIVPKTCHWLHVDFTSLQEPCYGYEDQVVVGSHCIEMASMAMIHFGFNPGKFVCWLSGEYTGKYLGWEFRAEFQRIPENFRFRNPFSTQFFSDSSSGSDRITCSHQILACQNYAPANFFPNFFIRKLLPPFMLAW
jgi:hypothetical protein